MLDRMVAHRPRVIIVNFNSGEHLAACLRSVAQHEPTAAVTVIDNASSDGSERAAELAGSQVALIRNRENAGFGRGVNQAVALASENNVLLLNPDCHLTAGALALLEDELAAHPECAITAPRVLDDDGTVQGSVRGDPTLLTGLFGRTTLLTRLFPQATLARSNVRTLGGANGHENVVADWVSGACMLVRRDVMRAVGGFDPRYFLYWEDADLCRRLRVAGYSTRYVPAAVVTHIGGGSSRSARALATRAFHRSAYIYYSTHVARNGVSRAAAWLLLHGRCQWKLLWSRFSGV